jgi:hypothetical protein
MLINDEMMYVQWGGRKVREVAYEIMRDGYTTPDMTILANHITDGDPPGIVDWDYQQEPDSIVWCVRADGALIGLTYEKEQEVVGWHPHITEGEFESIAIIPSEGGEDEIWVSVKRGSDRFIECFEPRDFGSDKEDGFFVDCGLSYDGEPTDTVSGLTHLAGKTVSICADGGAEPSTVVPSTGIITLEREFSKIHIGLPYEWKVKPMRIEAGMTIGTSQGQIKKIDHLTFRFYRTSACSVGPDEDHQVPIIFDTLAENLFSGDKRVTFTGSSSRDGDFILTNSSPLPLTLLGIIIEVNTLERGINGSY